MKDYSLDEQRILFKGAYKSLRKRVKDLGDFNIAFSENDRNALMLAVQLLTISRLNMQDMEGEQANNASE